MATLTPGVAWRGAAVLLIALALWNSWWARGLFLDGYSLLAGMIRFGTWHTFYEPREHLMAVTQAPAALAIRAGLTDTQTLARLLSIGLFAVPAIYYGAALHRARRDPVLLSAVLIAIGLVYVPTSFFIVGEHNAICAMAIFVAVLLATAARLSWGNGAALALTALVLFRSHEATLLLGPVLAGLTIWRMAALGWRSPQAGLHALAAALFAGSGAIALASLFDFPNREQMNAAFGNALSFTNNIQFMLPFVAVLAVALAGLARPRLLEGRGVYLGAGVLLAVAALSPLLWLLPGETRPLPKAHYETRQAAFVVAAGLAVFVYVYALLPHLPIAALQVVRRPAVGHRLLAFAAAVAAAALPADLMLTELWRRSLGVFQATIAARTFLIPVEETPISREPWRHFVEEWTLPMQSLVLRAGPAEGVIIPSRDFQGWQAFEPSAELPDLHPYYWGGGSGR
ncbi:MAG TPA: hypothetical protein VEC14_10160 [Reyranellaceae bacterium]|nr:hypothetical protein [Reyranellaceae bacterium]